MFIVLTKFEFFIGFYGLDINDVAALMVGRNGNKPGIMSNSNKNEHIWIRHEVKPKINRLFVYFYEYQTQPLMDLVGLRPKLWNNLLYLFGLRSTKQTHPLFSGLRPNISNKEKKRICSVITFFVSGIFRTK